MCDWSFYVVLSCFFFFSSRRRHTRFDCDWSSDVCSSDLDSSAQFGDQVARWRVLDDSLWLTLGDGVWQVHRMKLDADKLTLSGGDLEKPVTLRRVGPPPARADPLAIPPPPPPPERACAGPT